MRAASGALPAPTHTPRRCAAAPAWAAKCLWMRAWTACGCSCQRRRGTFTWTGTCPSLTDAARAWTPPQRQWRPSCWEGGKVSLCVLGAWVAACVVAVSAAPQPHAAVRLQHLLAPPKRPLAAVAGMQLAAPSALQRPKQPTVAAPWSPLAAPASAPLALTRPAAFPLRCLHLRVQRQLQQPLCGVKGARAPTAASQQARLVLSHTFLDVAAAAGAATPQPLPRAGHAQTAAWFVGACRQGGAFVPQRRGLTCR